MHKGHMAAYATHTTNKSTHLLTAQTNKKDKSHTKKPTFGKECTLSFLSFSFLVLLTGLELGKWNF